MSDDASSKNSLAGHHAGKGSKWLVTALCGLASCLPAGLAGAQTAVAAAPLADATASAAASAPSNTLDEVVVTARRREESLQDVPIAVTALSGDFLQQQQIYTVKDIAAYAPGLNINSDSAGRSFVSIRGIGTTLINTVQPGVGIFIDGIYEPDTSYLNTPLVDVQRVEVLRGPQGTLFGNNTLGGAINVITRQPTDEFVSWVSGAYAGTDHFYSGAASVSGPLIPGVLQGRLAISDQQEDGFGHNLVGGGYSNPLDQRAVNTTLRFEPIDIATFTMNAYYDRVFGGSTAYSEVSSPTDYTDDTTTNLNNIITLDYKGINLKGVFDVKSLATTVTAVIAFDRRDDYSGVDGDYGPVDFLRATGREELETKTAELRFDTTFNEHVSTLFGAFASRFYTDSSSDVTIVPYALTVPSDTVSEANQQALFGTAFWKFLDTWEITTGLRYDHQVLGASSATTAGAYKASEWEPRVSVLDHLSPDLTVYASIARGFRGGGQNGPGAPNLIYKGDSVVTEELGVKLFAFDHRLSLDTDVFYNNYVHFIGENALAPSTAGAGFVAINLNTGQVRSYGLESEGHFKVTEAWRLDAGLTLLHARVTNSQEYTEETGLTLNSDRVLFTPDWNYNVGTTYSVPLNDGGQFMDFHLGAVAKGSRTAATASETSTPVLSPYTLVDAAITYRVPHGEIALFSTNLFDKQYFQSYIDKSVLTEAGLGPLASDVGFEGDRRRVGIRGKWTF